MNRFYIPLACVSSMIFMACGNTDRSTDLQVKDTIPVTTIALNQIHAGMAIEATGIFTTDDETMLGFKNGGVISRIYVKEGDPVRKGQRLASVQSTEIDVKNSQALVGLEKAQRDYDRAKKLFQDSVATLEQMQNAKSALDVAKQDINAVNYNQQHMHIYSPVTGFVLAKLSNEGQVVGPGTPVLQVNGAGTGKWMLKVGVSDNQWASIQIGDSARIMTDVIPNKQLEAYVSKKSEGLDPQSGTFTIHLELKNKAEGKLASGVFGKSIILTKATNDKSLWQVPYESLVEANGKEAYVFVTSDNKTAKKQKVTLGQIEKDMVTVTSGLENVGAIIVSGSPYLVDGSAITIKTKQ